MNNQTLGQTFKQLRINRGISLKQATDDRVSLSQLSRFERGESELSISRFLAALENIHVEVSEFIDANANYQKTERKRLMSQLVDLEYRRDIQGFQRLQASELEKYHQHPYNQEYKLNAILLQGFICKCDPDISFPKPDLDFVTDYLFSCEHWNIYELILIGNLYLFFDLPLLHRMGQEILNRKEYYQNIGTHRHLVVITVLNIWETCLRRDNVEMADFYQQEAAKLLTDETELYEKNIFLFLQGLQEYKSGKTLPGIEKMNKSIQIYEYLGADHLAQNYRRDLEHYLK